MRSALIAAAAILGTAGAVQAGELTKDDFKGESVAAMVDLCSADESTDIGKYAIGFCYGWIEGVEQFYGELLADERFDVQPVACPGRALTRDESRTYFLKWAAANPDAASLPPLEGLVRAAKATFPCK